MELPEQDSEYKNRFCVFRWENCCFLCSYALWSHANNFTRKGIRYTIPLCTIDSLKLLNLALFKRINGDMQDIRVYQHPDYWNLRHIRSRIVGLSASGLFSINSHEVVKSGGWMKPFYSVWMLPCRPPLNICYSLSEKHLTIVPHSKKRKNYSLICIIVGLECHSLMRSLINQQF